MWSNCLIQAIIHKAKKPMNTRVFRKGKWTMLFRKGMFPHFYWYDKEKDMYFHFRAKYSDEPIWGQLYFEGNIEEYVIREKE